MTNSLSERRVDGAVDDAFLRDAKERLFSSIQDSFSSDVATVLDAMKSVPREEFVSFELRRKAYNDHPLPICWDQTISQPSLVADMTLSLQVEQGHRVLEVGTGSGYQAAILSRLCDEVYTIERHEPLLREAQQRFNRLDMDNIVSVCGDGIQGWPDKALTFDRIIVTAGVIGEEPPQALLDQLKVGGILIAPVVNRNLSSDPDRRVLRSYHKGEDGVEARHMAYVMFVPLLSGTNAFKRAMMGEYDVDYVARAKIDDDTLRNKLSAISSVFDPDFFQKLEQDYEVYDSIYRVDPEYNLSFLKITSDVVTNEP